jgi:hypothetical protein
MLHTGNAPLAMGNGIGGPGRKLDIVGGVSAGTLVVVNSQSVPPNGFSLLLSR